MNSRSESDALREERAALWAAKIDGGSLTAADRIELDTWLATDPRHRPLLTEYCQFSADLEVLVPAVVAGGKIPMPVTKRTQSARWPRVFWAAGTLAAAAAIIITVSVTRPSRRPETIATSVAQRKTLHLADGSQVELNARTSLLVDLSGAERRVRLADGEAFFTVAKDRSRPFVVETPAGAIRVTGTVFDVRTEPVAALGVTVVEGSVQVTPALAGTASAPVSLRANDELLVTAHGTEVHRRTNAEVDDALAWRQGYAVFAGTPLDQTLAKFARYHGRAITVDPAVARLNVGGRYSLDDLDGFLAAVEAALPVRVALESSGAIIVAPRAGS